jgi:hypothetical protein
MKITINRRLLIILGLILLLLALYAFGFANLPNTRDSGVYPLEPGIYTPAGVTP